MEGIKRLEQEVLKMDNFNVYTIFDHIKFLPELQDKFNNNEKTIKGMYKYIYGKAKTVKQGNVAIVNDRIVYLWAINYFKHSNEELGIKEKVITHPPSKKVENNTQQEEKNQQKAKKENTQISIFEEVV